MWHDGLTYKLIKLQFPDYLIKIIHNFLHNRTFRDRVNNTYSNTGFCLSGVPQGSVFSPYLYNIYTHDFPQHSTVSTCLFADDSAVLSQGVQLKYTIKAIQNTLDKLETWLTHWRIAINVDKSHAIIFRKWGVIEPPFQLTLFDDNIQWVSVVKYLGLHIDSRLTFKKHIDYLAEKFWGRIHLAISLIGRRSPLSLENKVILYKQILCPVITYGSPIWGAAATTHMKKIQEDSLFHSESSLKTFRDVKIHASKLRLLACHHSSNCNDLLPNMKTQRSAMSLKRLLPDTGSLVLRAHVPE
ncbi:RNA-directed DNA polymerase from mobile element jockey [Trichonephila clavipes]|uniref:RNA-directed DNA polymerase from mobile element jockey n=1 Tax=Trichonephila clavipes TaxID=2585209 RepID=A0A8X7B9X4_TRICX|nr:RNA-directed DNA polymerase from mobile element jockey [Trichonephila clavipes]